MHPTVFDVGCVFISLMMLFMPGILIVDMERVLST